MSPRSLAYTTLNSKWRAFTIRGVLYHAQWLLTADDSRWRVTTASDGRVLGSFDSWEEVEVWADTWERGQTTGGGPDAASDGRMLGSFDSWEEIAIRRRYHVTIREATVAPQYPFPTHVLLHLVTDTYTAEDAVTEAGTWLRTRGTGHVLRVAAAPEAPLGTYQSHPASCYACPARARGEDCTRWTPIPQAGDDRC